MKITAGGKTYDGKVDIVMIRTDSNLVYCNGAIFDVPINMVELSDKDLENIKNMAEGSTVYSHFPDGFWEKFPNIFEDMAMYFKNYEKVMENE